MIAKITKSNRSAVLIIPKEICRALNLKPREYVSLEVIGPNEVVMRKVHETKTNMNTVVALQNPQQ